MTKTITISVKVLEELISIADDYLAGEHQSETNKSYFMGKKDAYASLLANFNFNN